MILSSDTVLMLSYVFTFEDNFILEPSALRAPTEGHGDVDDSCAVNVNRPAASSSRGEKQQIVVLLLEKLAAEYCEVPSK